jgi:hypothetical protein
MPLVGTVLSMGGSDIGPWIGGGEYEPSEMAFNRDNFPAPMTEGLAF